MEAAKEDPKVTLLLNEIRALIQDELEPIKTELDRILLMLRSGPTKAA